MPTEIQPPTSAATNLPFLVKHEVNADGITASLSSMSFQQGSRPPFSDKSSNEKVTPKDDTSKHTTPFNVSPACEAAISAPEALDTTKSEVIAEDQQHAYLDNMFEEQAREKLLNIPKIKLPTKLFVTKLKEHQVQGIRWLAHQETNRDSNTNPFFKEIEYKSGEKGYRCSLTGTHQRTPPQPIEGTLLADDMGLGKTVQAIGLILTNPPENHVYAPKAKFSAVNGPFATLIVSPVSVMGNWVHQIEEHVKPGVLRVSTYAGPKRATLVPEIAKKNFDVVVVSYDTLRSELKSLEKAATDGKPKPMTLFSLDFHRIVLDEAHTIRNYQSSSFKAVSAIKAKNKVGLTGTPFVNNPDDIYSLLSFLKVDPLNKRNVFKEKITDEIKQGRLAGLARLRVAMAHVSLRRTKKTTELGLLPKTKIIKKVPFVDGAHKVLHDILYSTAKAGFAAILNADQEVGPDEPDVITGFRLMFVITLRIRQACCSGALLSTGNQDQIRLFAEEIQSLDLDTISPTQGLELLEKLYASTTGATSAEDDKDIQEDLDKNELPPQMIALMDAMTGNDSKALGSAQLLADSAKMSSTDVSSVPTPSAAVAKMEPSPKIVALMNTIEEMEPHEKGVIFSFFTSFLDLIQAELDAKGHTFTRIDGKMDVDKRMKAMRDFGKEDATTSPRFILCSLKACGTGINLTRGSVAFMLEPHWNEAAENQAADRIHRLGQKRQVRVYRFVMEDSIEERMVTLQRSKAALGKGSMEKLSVKEEKRAKLTAMKDLFEIKDDESDIWSDDDFIMDDSLDDSLD